jgi:hypothetical protein
LRNCGSKDYFPPVDLCRPAILGVAKRWGDTEQTENYPVKENDAMSMTREEIEQKMGELVNKYRETHDKGLIENIYELACELEKIKNGVKG